MQQDVPGRFSSNTKTHRPDILGRALPKINRVAIALCVAAFSVSVLQNSISAPIAEPTPGALTNALAQIAALQAEARALSPAQKKIASPLLDAHREFLGAAPRPYAPRIKSNLKLRDGGKILVDIRARVSDALLRYLKSQGASIQNYFPQYESIRAEIPIAALETIAGHADVKFIRAAEIPITNIGTATSEGFYAEDVDTAQTNFGVTGAGVKVGVLSDSVRYLANSQSAGDLGTVFILSGQSGIGIGTDEGEGTAMLEIVHDLAPDAQLYYATGDGGEPSMASNIIALADQGCGVIIDDISYSDESPFSANQPISQAVQTVSDRGVLYFSSAANSGNLKRGGSGTWTGDFQTYGFSPGMGQLHNWGGTPFNQITNQNGGVNLFWSDPLGGSTNDYNLFITDSNGNVLRQSVTVQNGSNDPYESVAASTNSGEYVVVALASGAQRDIYVSTGRGRLAIGTTGSTRGHNAAAAANAFSVAASSAHGGGPGLRFQTNSTVESFSCDGYPRLFFESDGTAVTPNNFTSTGGRVLLKPDITAADGTISSTNTFGTNKLFTPFYGTSAAAPHAGAIAALLLSYRPDLTAAQIRTALTNTALDIEAPGFDLDSGAGIVMAEAALESADNTLPLVAVTNPANGGSVQLLTSISGTASDVGSGLENNQIHFTLFNNGNFWSGTYWTNTSASDPTISLTAPVVNGAWTFTNVPTGQDQAPGTYFVSAFARDNAGNTSQAQSGVTSTSFTIDTTPPTIAITFPPDGSTITNQLFGNWFQGTASDNPANNLTVSLFIRRNSDNLYWTGSGWGDATNGFISNTYNSGNQTWQSTGALPIPGSSLANGDYHFIAIARDAAGNQQQVDSVVTVDFHPVFLFNYGSQSGPTPNMNWSDPANWDVGSVPTPDAIVVINNYSPNSTGLGDVSVYRLDLSGGALTTAGMTIQKLNMSGGSISGSPITIPANGIANWSGGTLNGPFQILSNATFNIISTGNNYLSGSAVLNNSGTVTWTNDLALYGATSSVINNSNIFEIRGNGYFYNNTGGSPQPTFNNYGIVRKTFGTNATVAIGDNGGWLFNQYGLLDIQTGALSFRSRLNVFDGSQFSGAGSTRVEADAAVLSGNSTILAGGTVELAGGTMNGSGGFTGAGTFAWSSGVASGNNTIDSGLWIKNDTDKTLTGQLTHTGTNGVWDGAGILYCAVNSIFKNTGSLQARSDAVAYNYTGGAPSPRFVNTGTFAKTAGTNTTRFHSDNGGVEFDNSGAVLAQSGIISLSGGGVHSNGTFNAASGAIIQFAGGTHSFIAPVNFDGAGRSQITGGSVALVNSTNIILNNATLELAGGSLTGNGAFAGPGTFDWSSGALSAVVTLQSNLNSTWSTGGNKTLAGGAINNFGTITWTSTGIFYGAANSIFSNSGTFNIQNDSTFYNYTGGAPVPEISNAGTIRKTVATGQTIIHQDNGGWNFSNTGLVDIQTGALSSHSQFNLNEGGSFSGAGVTRIDSGVATMSGSNYVATGDSIEFASGVMNGSGTFNGPGNFVWSGGTMQGNNGIGASGHFLISGGDKQLSGNFSNAGAAMWTGPGIVNCSVGSVFDNSGTLTASNATWFYNNSGGAPSPVFNNSGTFIKTGDTNVTRFHSDNGGVAFNNNGSVISQSGVLALTGGGVSSNGVFNAASGARIEIGGVTHYFNGGLNFVGAGITRITNGAVNSIGGTNTIASGATFEIASGSLDGFAGFGGPGIFSWTGGSISATLFLQHSPNLSFAISGANDKYLSGGNVHSAGIAAWTGSGNINGAVNSLLDNSGTFIIENDSVFYNYTGGAPAPAINNTGTIRKAIATGDTFIQPDNGGWIFSNSGLIDIQTGALASRSQFNVNAGGSFSGAGVTRIDGGAATLNGTSTILSGGTFQLASGGVMNGAGTFSGNGTFNWTGGAMNGNLSIGAATSFALSTVSAKQLNGIITNSGTATWTGAGEIDCSLNSVFNNTGTFIAQNDAQIYNYTGGSPAPVFNNAGTFRKTAATGTTTFSSDNGGVTFNNPGIVDLQTGTLLIKAGHSVMPSSQLKISLAGPNAGTNYGAESFIGDAPFDGTLAVSLVNGFIPTNGQTFVIANYPSRTGQFATTQLPPLPFNSAWSVNYSATALTLSVVPQAVESGSFASNGHFQITLTGPQASSAVLWASSNLFNWDPLFTNTPFTGAITFDDPQASQFTNRFYHAVLQP
jgi:hypothetical protein